MDPDIHGEGRRSRVAADDTEITFTEGRVRAQT